MKWFEGSIPDAIQRAKINKSVFIVYITGTVYAVGVDAWNHSHFLKGTRLPMSSLMTVL